MWLLHCFADEYQSQGCAAIFRPYLRKSHAVKLGIMQPYFLPYIGYFQLIELSDRFVLYDDAKYTKKGWMTRNRIQNRGEIRNISLSVKNSPDNTRISEKQVAETFDANRLIRQIDDAYRNSMFYNDARAVIVKALEFQTSNLFEYLHNSITSFCQYLQIDTEITRSSETRVPVSPGGEARVIDICRTLSATSYVNPIGGTNLYSAQKFKEHRLELWFLKSRLTEYPQSASRFIPSLSIVDVVANCSPEQIREEMLADFDLLVG